MKTKYVSVKLLKNLFKIIVTRKSFTRTDLMVSLVKKYVILGIL